MTVRLASCRGSAERPPAGRPRGAITVMPPPPPVAFAAPTIATALDAQIHAGGKPCAHVQRKHSDGQDRCPIIE